MQTKIPLITVQVIQILITQIVILVPAQAILTRLIILISLVILTNTEQNKDKDKTNNTQVTKPQTKTGWVTQNGQKSYLVKNRPVKGLKQINKDWYLFDKNGAMLTNVRKIPKQNNYGYFASNGKRQFKNTKTTRAYYWINKSASSPKCLLAVKSLQ